MFDMSVCQAAYDNVRSVFARIPALAVGTKPMGDASSRSRDSLMRLKPILGCRNILSGHVVMLGASGSDALGCSAEKIAPKNKQLPKLREQILDVLKAQPGLKHATHTNFRNHTIDEFISVRDGVACVITVRMDGDFALGKDYHPACAGVYVEFVSSRNRDARELIAIKATRPMIL
jgi:hypothetical protein